MTTNVHKASKSKLQRRSNLWIISRRQLDVEINMWLFKGMVQEAASTLFSIEGDSLCTCH